MPQSDITHALEVLHNVIKNSALQADLRQKFYNLQLELKDIQQRLDNPSSEDGKLCNAAISNYVWANFIEDAYEFKNNKDKCVAFIKKLYEIENSKILDKELSAINVDEKAFVKILDHFKPDFRVRDRVLSIFRDRSGVFDRLGVGKFDELIRTNAKFTSLYIANLKNWRLLQTNKDREDAAVGMAQAGLTEGGDVDCTVTVEDEYGRTRSEKVDCEELAEGTIIGGIILIAIALLEMAGHAIFGDIEDSFLYDLFDPDDDNRSRGKIKRSSCEELRRLPTSQILSMLDTMLEGTTGDADENAINKLLICLGCDRIGADIWNASPPGEFKTYGDWLLDNMHGSERDTFLIEMQKCGFVDFSSFDDDASRKFIKRNDCGVLKDLRVSEIRDLMLNMFDGPTLDEDESAIIRLLECQSCAKISQLLSMRATSRSDFSDEVDGREWRRVKGIFRACGH
jgi:hypothetical protein